jgi:hypothetical protein
MQTKAWFQPRQYVASGEKQNMLYVDSDTAEARVPDKHYSFQATL